MTQRDALKEIILKKKEKILLAKQNIPEEELKAKIPGLPATRPFIEAINKPHTISLIAEIKKASFLRGIIRQEFNPLDIARIYANNGAAAISVVTDKRYFQGDGRYLTEAARAVALPVLCKDFII